MQWSILILSCARFIRPMPRDRSQRRRSKRGRRGPYDTKDQAALHARLLAQQRDDDLEKRAERNVLRGASHEEMLLEWACALVEGDADAKPHRALTDKLHALAEDVKPGNLELSVGCRDLLNCMRHCNVLQSGLLPRETGSAPSACATCGSPAYVWMRFLDARAGVSMAEAKVSDPYHFSWGCAGRALIYHRLYHLDDAVARSVHTFMAESRMAPDTVLPLLVGSQWYRNLCALYTDPGSVACLDDTRDGWTRTFRLVDTLYKGVFLSRATLTPVAPPALVEVSAVPSDNEEPDSECLRPTRRPRRSTRVIADDDEDDHAPS